MTVMRWAVIARVGLLVTAGPQMALASIEPAVGIYSEYQYVTSASSNPSGLSGCDPVGATLGGYFHFTGPSWSGAYTTETIGQAGQMRMQVCKLPTLPAAGATSYSGTETCADTYQNAARVTYTESFTWTIKYVGNSAFLAQTTVTFPVSGGTCTEARDIGFEFTGK